MPNLHCAVEGPVKKTTSNSKIICMAIIHPYATNFWRTTMTTNNNNIHKNDISTSKERGCALTCVQIQNLHISTLTCQGQKYVNLGLCWVWVCIHMWFGGGLWQTCGLVRQAGILLQPLPTFVAAPMPHQPAMLIFVVHQFMRRAGPFWMQSCQNISTDVISDQIISVIIPRTCYTQVILTPFNIWSLRSSLSLQIKFHLFNAREFFP